jgi:hypothetical protein
MVIVIIMFYYSVEGALIPSRLVRSLHTFSDRSVESASNCILILVQCRDHLHMVD